ncbi:MAG: T9SS type A sorting domain-containing protein [Cryomorphaceae bacterium]|nr:T9SS type A sorting domain-containing protein [Cryomorphaceae bacterium]
MRKYDSKVRRAIIFIFLCVSWGVTDGQFSTVTNSYGLFANTLGGYLGSGASCADFDGDGFNDFTFATSNSGVLCYKNVNGSSATLVDFGLTVTGDIKQVLWVDYDNDGDQDLFLTRHLTPCLLFRRDDAYVLTDVSASAGMPQNTNWETFGASFGDYDCDGGLDFYICNYNVSGTTTNHLFRNNLDGTFSDVTVQSGTSNGVQNTFQSCWIDYNLDGRLDLYVINDRLQYPNALYLNNGDGTFTDVAIATNSNLHIYAMTITPGDFDNDADEDIYITNGLEGNAFLVNEGTTFQESALEYGLTINALCWGAQWIDFDNDGFQDLYVTTSTETETQIPPAQNYLFQNNGNGFDAITNTNVNTASHTHCNLRTDVNNDGFPDIVNHTSSPYSSIYASIPNNNHWVKITLEGTYSNRDAIGTMVRVYCAEQTFTRRLYCGESYLGQHAKELLFGLGDNDSIDSLVVSWPSGLIETHTQMMVDQTINLVEGSTMDLTFEAETIQICDNETHLLVAADCPNCTIEWSDGSSEMMNSVSESGEYSYILTLPHGQTLSSDTLEIVVVETPQINLMTTPTSCDIAFDGSVTVSDTFGIEDLKIDNENFETTNMMLSGGEHLLSYSYSGCSFDTIIIIPIADLPEIEVMYQPISCFGLTTSIEFAAADQFILDIEPQNFNPLSVSAGVYDLVFELESGCSVNATVEISEPPLIEIEILSVNPNDEGGGAIMLNIQGGVPPYFLQWVGPNEFLSSNNPIANLAEGTYTCIIQDTNGCLTSINTELTLDFITDQQLFDLPPFPNPTDRYLNFRTTDQTLIQLVDLEGRILLADVRTNGSLGQLDLGNLDSGVYLLLISNKKRVESVPIIVQKH